MGGLSKLSRVLTIIFLISVVTLFAELFYVLWRRRVFRRRNPQASTAVDGGGDQPSHYSSSDSSFLSIASSKEFLYAFCIRSHSHSRVEPNSTTPTSSNGESEIEEIDSDIVKLQVMHGPSRFLFTIKEEEKEDLESVAEKSLCSSAEKESNKSNSISIRERVTLKECLEVVEEPPKAAMVVHDHGDGGGVRDEAEFPTPCDSPMYFTPLASPIHEEVNDR